MCPSSQQVSAFLSCPKFGRGHLFCLHNSFRWTMQVQWHRVHGEQRAVLFGSSCPGAGGGGGGRTRPMCPSTLGHFGSGSKGEKKKNPATLCLKVKSYYDLKGLGTHLYLHCHAVDTRDTYIYCSRWMCNDSRSIELWFART